jgi:CubicO group peptidase (beta-lactamase class C family)
MEIHGHCDSAFDRVKNAFSENFRDRHEVGASVAVTIDGRVVLDLWAGFASQAAHSPWCRNTIVNVYSASKGLTALCIHRLADQGKLDLDAPIARYWPEFAQAGKVELPVHLVLSHRAGLPAIKQPLTSDALYDWEAMTSALAAQAPWWPPGSKHGYHALTFGYLLGELVRRTTGKSLGTYLREEIAGPLEIDCFIGFDAAEDSRVADIVSPPPMPPEQQKNLAMIFADPESVAAKAISNPSMILKIWSAKVANSRRWRSAEIPAGNAHTNARAFATLYGALASGGGYRGVQVLTEESIRRCCTEQSNGPDAVNLTPTRFSLGFGLSLPDQKMGPNPRAFGHSGAGGSIGFADPDASVGFGYAMNQMLPGNLIDVRAAALIDALYGCL